MRSQERSKLLRTIFLREMAGDGRFSLIFYQVTNGSNGTRYMIRPMDCLSNYKMVETVMVGIKVASLFHVHVKK